MTNDQVMTMFVRIAKKIEQEIRDNSIGDDLLSVRGRALGQTTLALVQAIIADDWLLQAIARDSCTPERVHQMTD